jgi:hypothetical protein
MELFGEEHSGTELDFDRREVVVRADLGGLEGSDCVWTSLRFLMRGPRRAPGPRARTRLA